MSQKRDQGLFPMSSTSTRFTMVNPLFIGWKRLTTYMNLCHSKRLTSKYTLFWITKLCVKSKLKHSGLWWKRLQLRQTLRMCKHHIRVSNLSLSDKHGKASNFWHQVWCRQLDLKRDINLNVVYQPNRSKPNSNTNHNSTLYLFHSFKSLLVNNLHIQTNHCSHQHTR